MTTAPNPKTNAPAPQPMQNDTTTRKPVGFLGRLSVPQKIGLITLALSAPLAYSVYNNIVTANKELQVVQSQQEGFQYLQALSDLIGETQQSQSAVSSAINAGNRGESLNLAEVQQVTQNIEALVQLSQTLPLDESVNEGILSTRETWQQFLETLQGPQPPNNRQLAEIYEFLFNNQIYPLTQTVVQSSQLNNSTDTAVNSLLGLTANLFPSEWNTSGYIRPLTVRAYGEIDPATGKIAAVNQREYQVRLSNARSSHNLIVSGMERAIENAPNQAEQLQPKLEMMQSTMGAIFQNFELGFLTSDEVKVPKDTAIEALQPSYDAQLTAYQASINALGTELERIETAARNRQLISAALLILGLALAAILAYSILRAITRAIETLTRTANRLQVGDFSVRTPITSADEFATLGASLNAAATQLQENEQRVAQERLEQEALQNNIGSFLDVTMDIADGDLTKRGTVTEDVLGNVVDSINLMTEELAYVLTGTRDAATSVTQGSSQMLNSTEAIRSSTLKTTETAQRVAEQTRTVTEQIEVMARNAQASAQTARQVLEASLQGQQAVQKTLGGMESIRESSQTTAQRIQELSQRSKEISNIVDAISQIASQTNLLSLHASIEAAGAGEAGERFRVVADEVRELADQSAQAATQITSLITGIQREIAELTVAIRENTEQVNQGYEVAGTAGSSLEQIGELSRESARLAEQISLTTREQVNNIQTVNASVQEIAMTAEESQRSVDQGRAAAEQLQQLANQLTESLARFRLPKA